MHAHLSDFLADYIRGLSAVAPDHASPGLREVARCVPDYDADTLEALYQDIARWLDDGIAEPEVGLRLASARLVTARG